jgi:hypothetical protein
LADLGGEFAFLAAAVRRSVDLLRAHPQGGAIQGTERGSVLTGHIEHTLAGIDAKLDDAQLNFNDANTTEKIEYIKRARLLNSYARFMHKAVPWISAAARPPLTLGALYFIDELGQRICGSKPDAILNPSTEFSTEWWPFRILFPALGLTEQGGATPVVLNFSEREASSHLLLPLYGHELGHTAVEAHKLVQRVLNDHSVDGEFAAKFNKARDDAAAATVGQTQREVGISLAWRLEWWITELLCDQLAVQVLGPSFLYAFSSFLLGDAWDDPGERHPPTCIRIAHLVDYLTQSQWDIEIRRRAPTTLDWLVGDVAATQAKANDNATQFLLYAAGRVRDTIRTTTTTYLGSAVYTTAEFRSEIVAIKELTDYETLPAQLPNGDPVDRRAIMLAAWLSILEPADQSQTLASAPADIRTQAFFAKAIEMSALLAAWKATP